MTDLSTLSANTDEAGVPFTVKHPVTNKPLDIQMWVVSGESNVYRNEMMALAQEKPPEGVDQHAWRQQQGLRLTARCIRNWEGIELDGKAYPYSHENAVALMEDPRFRWLFLQVQEAMQDRSLFFGKPGKS